MSLSASSSQTNQRTFRHAQQHLRNRRIAIADDFKQSLLVASNTVQFSRMLQNLQNLILVKRAEQDADADHLEEQVNSVNDFFQTAIEKYSKADILNAEGQIEHLTLFYDPKYLEGEEAHKRDYFERRKQLKEKNLPKQSWTSSTTSRFLGLLKGDIAGVEEVTVEEQRSCISKCAWGFAILGMCIAIIFLILDYWQSQANPALSTSIVQNDYLQLPVIFACVSMPHIPLFLNYPTSRYKGNAMWGLSIYRNIEANHTLVFPHTSYVAEPSFLGSPEFCPKALQYLSKQNILSNLAGSNDPHKSCYSCLKIGARIPVFLSRKAATLRPSGAVTLGFASSNTLELCFNPTQHANVFYKQTLLATLRLHIEDIEARGVVIILNPKLSLENALDFGFEAFENESPAGDYTYRTKMYSAQATVFCNMYLFSGVFFPVEPGTEIRYEFDITRGIEAWKPIGNLSNFLDIGPHFDYNDQLVSKTDLMAVLRDASSFSRLTPETAINIYSVAGPSDRPDSLQHFHTALRMFHRDVLLFTKSSEEGKSRHTSVMQQGAQRLGGIGSEYRRYNISFDFATFETERVIRRPTTSTAEFLTDIFEYVGLFTGICAYSVLVGPARMYLKSLGKRNRPDGNQNGQTA